MIRGFTARDVASQRGKTVLVTGANTGIGFEAAKVLASQQARVILGCRSRERAEAARQRILEATPDAELHLVDLDLGDLSSVRRAAEEVAREPRLDVLINNAGVMMPPKQLTPDGFELQFGVNHLGHFALTCLLLPTLEQTEGSRVVITSSNGHRMGGIDFEDPQAERSYSPLGRYSMSKLANLLHMYELHRRLSAAGSSTIAVAVHPGGTDTDLFRHLPGALVWMLRPLAWPLLNQPAAGAWPTLLAATHPQVQGGQYFGPGRLELSGPAKQVGSNARSRDPELARRLWDLSVQLTGIDPPTHLRQPAAG
ncbi:MAG: SDR family NAD(P)-dependent oxidoreductase [Myxococcales bacterium]|nr:SDR family NAD(P)-dependent oxidoreductase [Myxococcales bacterium]